MSDENLELLLVEDNQDDAFFFERAVRRAASGELKLSCVDTLREAIERSGDGHVDVVFLDLSLPDSNGLDTFLTLHERYPDLPVVVLTGNDDERLAAEALLRGAQDYLLKGKFQGEALLRSARFAIERQKSRDLERANAELTTEVRERVRNQEELQKLASKLERSNKELQQFASVASHDLQEPLRKIIVFGDRLRKKSEGRLTEDAADYLDRMSSAAERMQTLINDLLQLSRVVTRAEPFSAIDLGEVVGEVLRDLELLIERSDATVEVDSLPTIDADPTQLRQLLQNLIQNALKFRLDDRKPVVRIHAEIDRQPTGDLCRLTVQDNGIGFDEKYLDRIFNPFQRLHGRGEYDGSGMGLAICRRIADRHGGQITASSAPGEGATFHVVLPTKQPDPEAGIIDSA